jgi:ATP-dependent RNA helicase DDX43
LGTSLSFLTRSDWGSAKELIEILTEANQEVPDELVKMAERFQAKKESGGFRGGRGRGGGGFRGNRF